MAKTYETTHENDGQISCITDAANLVVKLLHEQGMFLLDIREAVRALKPRPALSLHDPDFYEKLHERIKPTLDSYEQAEVERLRAKVADQALTIATLKDELGKLRAPEYGLQYATPTGIKSAWQIDQEVEALRAELAQTRHLLSEERALTAATVGKPK